MAEKNAFQRAAANAGATAAVVAKLEGVEFPSDLADLTEALAKAGAPKGASLIKLAELIIKIRPAIASSKFDASTPLEQLLKAWQPDVQDTDLDDLIEKKLPQQARGRDWVVPVGTKIDVAASLKTIAQLQAGRQAFSQYKNAEGKTVPTTNLAALAAKVVKRSATVALRDLMDPKIEMTQDFWSTDGVDWSGLKTEVQGMLLWASDPKVKNPILNGQDRLDVSSELAEIQGVELKGRWKRLWDQYQEALLDGYKATPEFQGAAQSQPTTTPSWASGHTPQRGNPDPIFQTLVSIPLHDEIAWSNLATEPICERWREFSEGVMTNPANDWTKLPPMALYIIRCITGMVSYKVAGHLQKLNWYTARKDDYLIGASLFMVDDDTLKKSFRDPNMPEFHQLAGLVDVGISIRTGKPLPGTNTPPASVPQPTSDFPWNEYPSSQSGGSVKSQELIGRTVSGGTGKVELVVTENYFGGSGIAGTVYALKSASAGSGIIQNLIIPRNVSPDSGSGSIKNTTRVSIEEWYRLARRAVGI